jgi:DNA-binding response OmpR family regulator
MCKQGAKKYLEYRGLIFDFDSAVFSYSGKPLALSKSCKRLLLIFIKTPEKTVSHLEIQRQLWGDYDCALKKRDISERIQCLRKQLPVEVAKWVVAVVGEGYVLTELSDK